MDLVIAGSDPDSFTPGAEAAELLALLAWCVSAAGVAGVIVVGTHMAMQLRRGEPGEGSTHFRALTIVIGACVIAATAGPLVEALGPLTLQ